MLVSLIFVCKRGHCFHVAALTRPAPWCVTDLNKCSSIFWFLIYTLRNTPYVYPIGLASPQNRPGANTSICPNTATWLLYKQLRFYVQWNGNFVIWAKFSGVYPIRRQKTNDTDNICTKFMSILIIFSPTLVAMLTIIRLYIWLRVKIPHLIYAWNTFEKGN